MKKHFPIIFIVILAIIIVIISVVKNVRDYATVTDSNPSPRATTTPSTNNDNNGTTSTDITKWTKEYDGRAGVEFSHPPTFFDEIIAGHPAPELVFSKPIPVTASQSANSIILQQTYYDVTQDNPTSIFVFTQEKIGDHTFYFLETGRDEGTIGYVAHFVYQNRVYPVNISWYVGSKWNQASYHAIDDPLFSTFKKILGTVKVK